MPSVLGTIVVRLLLLPAAFAAFLPPAASPYLVTTTAWTVAQTVALRHWVS